MKKKTIRNIFLWTELLLIIMLLSHIIFNSKLYNQILNVDNSIINYINLIRNNYLTIIFKIITEFGNIYIPIFIIILLLVMLKNKKIGLYQALSYSFSGLVCFCVKEIIRRPRPSFAIIELPSSFSFPSGHTLTSFVFFMVLSYLLTEKKSKNIKIICYTLSVFTISLIGFSRIYLGVHYFSDVIGGLVYGVVTFMITLNIIKFLCLKNKKH